MAKKQNDPQNIFNLKTGKPVRLPNKDSRNEAEVPRIRSMAIPGEKEYLKNIRESFDLVTDYLQSDEPDEDIDLLEEALEIFPENYVAWALKGENAEHYSDSMLFYQEAYNIMHKNYSQPFPIKRDNFRSEEEVLQLFLDVSYKYADMLELFKKYDHAIQVYELMLDLEPLDPFRVKSVLLLLCVIMEERELFKKIYLKYKNDTSAFFLYDKLLFEYTESPDSLTTQSALMDALQANPHVPERLPDWIDCMVYEEYAPGSVDEAETIAERMGMYWDMIPGAIRWLRQQAKTQRKN